MWSGWPASGTRTSERVGRAELIRLPPTADEAELTFADVHAWTATTNKDARAKWAGDTEKLAALPGLRRVIPGHQMADSTQTAEVFAFTSKYVQAFDEAADDAKSAEELTAAMAGGEYRDLGGQLFLNLGAQAHYAPKAE